MSLALRAESLMLLNAGKVSEVLAYKAGLKGAKFVSHCGVKKVITSGELFDYNGIKCVSASVIFICIYC